MYSISGLPLAVSGVPPVTALGFALTWPPPSPILSVVLVGTLVRSDTTLARAAPVGPFDALLAGGLLFALTTMKATTIATTAMMLPDAIRIRRRCSARRSAARWAAIRSRRLLSTFVLLALPMLASSNLASASWRPGRTLLVPSLRRRAGVVRHPGYRALS